MSKTMQIFYTILTMALVCLTHTTAQAQSINDKEFTLLKDVEYGKGRVTQPQEIDKSLLLDIYLPGSENSTKLANSQGLRPGFFIIHGGGFNQGTKSQAALVKMAKDMVNKGYVVASIDYRVGPQGPVLSDAFLPVLAAAETQKSKPSDKIKAIAALEDSLKALHWFTKNAENYAIDTNRIAILGSSAGSDTAINLAYRLNDFSIERPKIAAVVNLWGGLTFNDSRTIIKAGDPPLFIYHGTDDPLRAIEDAKRLYTSARMAGVTVEFHPIDKAGHSFGNTKLFSAKTSDGTLFINRLYSFIDSALNNPPNLTKDLCLGTGNHCPK